MMPTSSLGVMLALWFSHEDLSLFSYMGIIKDSHQPLGIRFLIQIDSKTTSRVVLVCEGLGWKLPAIPFLKWADYWDQFQ